MNVGLRGAITILWNIWLQEPKVVVPKKEKKQRHKSGGSGGESETGSLSDSEDETANSKSNGNDTTWLVFISHSMLVRISVFRSPWLFVSLPASLSSLLCSLLQTMKSQGSVLYISKCCATKSLHRSLEFPRDPTRTSDNDPTTVL